MEKTISPSKSAIQFGVVFGVLMIFEFVISYVLNIDPIKNKSYGIIANTLNFMVFPLVFISIGCNNFKNKLNNGFISFGESLKIGVTICVFAALLYAIFNAVFNMIFPEFVEDILIKTKDVMLQQNPNMTSEQVETAISWTRKFLSPALSIPVTIVMYAFFGLIYSLIIGAIIKKDRQQSF